MSPAEAHRSRDRGPQGPQDRRVARRLPTLVLVLLGALAARMALPAAHAWDRAPRSPHPLTAAPRGPEPSTPELSRAAPPAGQHDPATCPVCQTLLHASPAAPQPASLALPVAGFESLLVVSAPRAHTRAARSGHPPRAPPA